MVGGRLSSAAAIGTGAEKVPESPETPRLSSSCPGVRTGGATHLTVPSGLRVPADDAIGTRLHQMAPVGARFAAWRTSSANLGRDVPRYAGCTDTISGGEIASYT